MSCACSAIQSSSPPTRRSYPPVTEDLRLDLVDTTTFGSRMIYERYGRARDESD
jgi:hypothetical protein